MKRHPVRTIKLLGIACAAVSVAGCAETRPPAERELPAQAADSRPRAAAPAYIAAPVDAPAPAEPAVHEVLDEDSVERSHLRNELIAATRAQATAGFTKFRALCDADGYPLVGNIMAKGPEVVGYQPSEFCHTVRDKH